MYYRNIAAHLLRGAELKVKPEEAARVIAVMEEAEKSSKTGRIEKVPYHNLLGKPYRGLSHRLEVFET